ncbi:MAG: pilus assembly protein [Coriobacteriia bacterium]|nr:pilus assembly protein [Coriobacteriia bacterium]
MAYNSISRQAQGQSGQGTVEAALVIPVLFLLLLMLMQPAILFYNRMVMENAAAETCRLLATKTDFSTYSTEKYEGYVKRRLSSIPPLDIFHASSSGKAWLIELSGDENSSYVTVSITNYLKPLPLIGGGAALLGMLEDGYLVQTVVVTMPTQPSWASQPDVGPPGSWPGQWED